MVHVHTLEKSSRKPRGREFDPGKPGGREIILENPGDVKFYVPLYPTYTRLIVEFGKIRYFWLLAGQRLTTLVSGGSHSVASPRTPYLWS